MKRAEVVEDVEEVVEDVEEVVEDVEDVVEGRSSSCISRLLLLLSVNTCEPSRLSVGTKTPTCSVS